MRLLRFLYDTCIDSVQVYLLVGALVLLIVGAIAAYQGPEVLVRIWENAQ